jgi:hypothetical protein
MTESLSINIIGSKIKCNAALKSADPYSDKNATANVNILIFQIS